MEIWQLAVLFAILAVVAWWLSMTAGRIDRVHIRKDDALNSLRLQLAWRASATSQLVSSGLLDPVSADILANEIERVSHASTRSLSEYLEAESEFTDALCRVFDEAEEVRELADSTRSALLISELASVCRRVQLARRFHNDAVGAAQLLRRRTVVRWLRLAGHTPWPSAIGLADEVPSGLEQFA